jgi:hypothetical protein
MSAIGSQAHASGLAEAKAALDKLPDTRTRKPKADPGTDAIIEALRGGRGPSENSRKRSPSTSISLPKEDIAFLRAAAESVQAVRARGHASASQIIRALLRVNEAPLRALIDVAGHEQPGPLPSGDDDVEGLRAVIAGKAK